MKVGIGLPATIPDVKGEAILEWARAADEGPFSSLGIIDRLVYGNYEALVTLAAAAGTTQRIRLMSTVIIAPLRNATVLAKQALSVDALSGGRFVLGLGVGGREDDYLAAGEDFQGRGRKFDRMLETMYEIWSGSPVGGSGPIGPATVRAGGPEVLIGGFAPAAIARLSRYGNGYISGGGGPDMSGAAFEVARRSWKEGGRDGQPYLAAGLYFGLGDNARERGGAYIRDYYSFLGPIADGMAGGMPVTPEAVKGAMQGFVDIGCDELILWPTIPDLDQVQRAADVVG